MSLTDSHLQQLYKAYLETPLLWKCNSVLELHQLQIKENKSTLFKRKLNKQLRLGQLVEQFVFNQLEGLHNCEILAENIQIQKEKQTLGELDALLKQETIYIHLEIIYKFYLYDATIGSSEVEHWIGPNRNDSLIEKINKLKNKQLPLLYSSECEQTLNKLGLYDHDYQQKVLFKAQLFMPFKNTLSCKELNDECIQGYYINLTQLEDFISCEFYIPSKLDWLLDVNPSVQWLSFNVFKIEVEEFISQSKSPLIWIKKQDGFFLKSFLVWW